MFDVAENNNFDTYWSYIKACVSDVLSELSFGNTDSMDVLYQHIDRSCQILCFLEAFELITVHSPYEWNNLLNSEVMERYNYDLGNIVLEVANSVIFRDTLYELSKLDSYRFLEGDRKSFSCIIPDGSKVVFKEIWKAHAGGLDFLAPLSIEEIDGKELTHYREGGESMYTLTHNDPALVWSSEKIIPRPDMTVGEFEEIKVEMLLKHNFSKDLLWLTEVQKVCDFNRFYADQTSPDTPEIFYGVQHYHYILYYHESGEIHAHAGFNTLLEFERACHFLCRSVKK